MDRTGARQRLNAPHYHLTTLLTLPFPLLLLLNSPSSSTLTLALLTAPVLIALSSAARSTSDNVESLHESTTFQLRLFNLFGLIFTRNLLGTGKRWIAAYCLAWLLVSFFFPQPPYLGLSNLRELTSEEFDTQVLLIPTARDAASAFANAPLSESNRLVDLDDVPDTKPPLPLGSPDVFHLVLFHIDFSKKSRDLQMTLARLSALYSSPTLSFSLLTPTAAPTTFYDLSLSTSPTTMDLPLLRLYKGGKVVYQEPLSEESAKAARKEGKRAARKEGRALSKKREEPVDSDIGSDTDSEDEREIAQEVALRRYRWDRSAEAIVGTFRLAERSGVGIVRPGEGEGRKEQ
ncbi:hypothetical protein JCM8547_002801 [Rhodosporidiobolus lusitaniae]